MTPIGIINHPYGEPNVNLYNPNDSYFSHPYGTRNNGHENEMIGTKVKRNRIKRRKKGHKKAKKQERNERERLENKANSPGVPPNTCPYIDMVISMVSDLQSAYERLREKGEYQPMVDRIAEQTKDMLEYIRTSNETLRDNSGFWYEKYKEQLDK